MQRVMLELIYHRYMCVLHRSYLTYQRENPKFNPSRDACITAALGILDIQLQCHKENHPGCRLYEDRWMLSLVTLHDSLLAAMIVCLDLSESAPGG